MKSTKRHQVLVSCPFCSTQIESRKLAEHAKNVHSREHDHVHRANGVPVTPMDGIVVRNPDLIREIQRHVIDESGVLVRPGLLGVNDQRRTRDERIGGAKLPQRRKLKKGRNSKVPLHSATTTDQEAIGGERAAHQGSKSSKASDEVYRSKVDWLESLPRRVMEQDGSFAPGLQPCPVCGVKVKTSRLPRHVARVHESASKPQTKPMKSKPQRQLPVRPTPPAQRLQRLEVALSSIRDASPKPIRHRVFVAKNSGSGEPGMTSCPHCAARVKTARLGKHMAKVHHTLNRKSRVIEKSTKLGRPPASKTPPKARNEAGRGWKPEQIDELEAFRQSFDESRDGSKGLGHMRREGDGKFGSFPLHDDYGDEALA